MKVSIGQIFNVLFCPQNLSTVLKFRWRNWCICEHTFAFKKKSTQKITDLVEVKKIFFIISVTKKRDCRRRQERNLTPLFSIKFYWCAQQNLLTALIRWETTASVCPTWFLLLLFKLWWLILLAYCQNSLCSWNILIFQEFILHLRVFSPDKFWQFCRESTTFFWPYSSGLFFCRFPSLYRSNSFQFWIKRLF